MVAVNGTGVNPGSPSLRLRNGRELCRRLQQNLLEQRVIALQRSAVRTEIVAVVADAKRGADGGAPVIRRVRDTEPRRPAAVEVAGQRPAVVRGREVNQSVLQAKIRLPVFLFHRTRQQVPSETQIHGEIPGQPEIILREESDEVNQDVGTC